MSTRNVCAHGRCASFIMFFARPTNMKMPNAPSATAMAQHAGLATPTLCRPSEHAITNGTWVSVVMVRRNRMKRETRGLLPIARAPACGGGTLDAVLGVPELGVEADDITAAEKGPGSYYAMRPSTTAPSSPMPR